MYTRRRFISSASALFAALATNALTGGNAAAQEPNANQGLVSQASTAIPRVALNNGKDMPVFGFGTYRAREQTEEAVKSALRNGYRLIDTAAYYGNEEQVGEGIARSGVPREQIFVTTKLWMADYGRGKVRPAFETSLRKLGLDYVDLYLLHYPTPRHFSAAVESYRVAEELRKEGRLKAIGVSNFADSDLERLIEETGVVPAVNQIEIHPYFNQRKMREVHARHGIVTQAWSPIGGIFINHPKGEGPVVYLLQDPEIARVARKYGRTPAQIVLRWHFQNGVAVIPKSVHAERIAGNINIFDFELAAAEMDVIDSLDRNLRGGTDPQIFDMDFLRARAKANLEKKSPVSR